MPDQMELYKALAVVAVLIVSFRPATTMAQETVIPDAGQLLDQVRPMLPLPAAPLPEKSAVPTEAPLPEGPRIQIGTLRITGASVFTESELHALVADAEGQALFLTELQGVADRLTQYYRQRGYVLAFAYVPAQRLADGVITLAIVEGRIGAITERNDHVVGGAAMAPLTALKSGEVAQSQTLERSLLLLSDLPGVAVTSTLKPGSVAGTSDLAVEVAPGARITGQVDVDGNGDRFTGRVRGGATINLNNPLQLGDQLTVRGLTSDGGFRYLFGDYRLPVNRYGTRIRASLSNLHYQLGDALKPLGLEGDARTLSVMVSHPLVRARRLNIYAELQADAITMQDRVGSTGTTIDRKIRLWHATLNGNWVDNWGGSSSWSAEYASGNLAQDADTALLDALGPKAAGHFEKWHITLRRLQGITHAMDLLMSFTGQLAEKNLDSSQKIALGGARGVRAYPQSEGFGDQGYVATAELRSNLPLPIPGRWQGTVFVDHGMIEINKNPWSALPNTRHLSGGGLGLNALFDGNWSVSTSLAWRLGADLPRNDIDRLPRGWVQVVKGF